MTGTISNRYIYGEWDPLRPHVCNDLAVFLGFLEKFFNVSKPSHVIILLKEIFSVQVSL